jgi:hypothetical protein
MPALDKSDYCIYSDNALCQKYKKECVHTGKCKMYHVMRFSDKIVITTLKPFQNNQRVTAMTSR